MTNANSIKIVEGINGSDNIRATGSISAPVTGQCYRLLAVSCSAATIRAWTDANSPWLTGKVGFRQASKGVLSWDNIVVSTDAPGTRVSYDDYFPYGQVMEGRSMVTTIAAN